MKTNHLLRKFAVVAVCIAMTFGAKAVKTTALNFADLQSQFAAASASGVRDTIQIGGAINVNTDYSMVSAGDTVVVYIYLAHDSITVTAGTLTIGNKVKIQSVFANPGALQAASGGNIVFNTGSYLTATGGSAVRALAGGTITVNDGDIRSLINVPSPIGAAGGTVTINGGRIITAHYPAVSAGMNLGTSIAPIPSGGTVIVNGGTIASVATATLTRGIVVDYGGTCIVNGGEIHADPSVSGRAISINSSNSGGKIYINGGTITAMGISGRAIQLDNLNAMLWVNGSPTIKGGLEAIMLQKNGVAVVSGTPTLTGVIGTNATTAKLYDARGLSAIVATPGQGYYAAQQTVSLTGGTGTVYKYVNTTAQASATIVTPTSLVYTTDGTTIIPYTGPVTMAIPSVLYVSPLIETTIGGPTIFNYWAIGTPMTSAPTPTAPANKVASIFSDAYTSDAGAGTNFNPGWGQSTVGSIIQVGTDNVLKYVNLNYQGTQFANTVHATDLKYLHVDAFSSTETSLTISCISPGTPNKEFAVALTPINLNAWNSYDIPLSSFTGVDMSNLIQLKVVGSGGNTVYLDNIYLYTDVTTDTEAPTAFTATKGTVADNAVTLSLNATDNSGVVFFDITYGTKTVTTTGILSGAQTSFTVSGLIGSTNYSFSIVARDRTGNAVATPIVITATTLTPMPAAPTPTRLAAQVKSIYSDAYTPAVTVTAWDNWWMMSFSNYTFPGGNNGKKVISTSAGGCGSPTFTATPFDATGMTLVHVDVYPISTITISLQVVTITTTSANWVSLGTLTPNQWNSIDIPVTSFTNSVKTDIKQVGFQTTNSLGTFYMDNLYFWKDPATSVANVSSTTVKCYPSQVTDRLTVKAETEISQVIVRNLLGQSVKSIAVNSNEQSIDLSAVSAGNYFVTVKLANGQSATQKIIKL